MLELPGLLQASAEGTKEEHTCNLITRPNSYVYLDMIGPHPPGNARMQLARNKLVVTCQYPQRLSH